MSSELAQKLLTLTRTNLWWTWHPEVRSIFRDIDLELYLRTHENPLAFLGAIDPEVLERRAIDVDAPARVDRALRHYEAHLTQNGKWGSIHASALGARPVAYFCMEFGVHESLPIYSGGLGILAGDHLKAASHLGVPMVAVGLLYHQGYTMQVLNREYWQEDVVEPLDLEVLPVSRALDPDGNPVRVGVELPGRTVYCRVYQANVGNVRLLLLDTRDDANSEHDRTLAARLYGGDLRTRIQQEIILGVGGSRALRAMGITPGVYHLNEGHCSFAILEWARHRIHQDGIDPIAALQIAGSGTVFTTHTPVEAGHDHFPADLAAEHLAPIAEQLGMPVHDVLGLGRVHPDDPDSAFLPTVMALKMARRTNSVSALHGDVSRKMWQHLHPGVRVDDVPIGHVTNGVHVLTWLSMDLDHLLRTHLGVHWSDRMANPDTWQAIYGVEDAEIWDLKRVLKARMLRFATQRIARMNDRLDRSAADLGFRDPHALTIGFSRRFVPYKRPDLIFRDPDRLAAIVNNPERPVNLIFAGRAHPADHPGKTLIQKVTHFTDDPRFRGRIVFIENYNIHVGRMLYHGVDAWLNNPRRPYEACGTSGMKVAMNAGLHISILDGWWAEAYDGMNGFAIGNGESHVDPEVQDARDAEALYRTLEREVIPTYYDRDERGVPTAWIARVKRSMATLGWRFSADRMMKDYVRSVYLPTILGESCRMPAVSSAI